VGGGGGEKRKEDRVGVIVAQKRTRTSGTIWGDEYKSYAHFFLRDGKKDEK